MVTKNKKEVYNKVLRRWKDGVLTKFHDYVKEAREQENAVEF